ncbi:MAG: transposase [Trichodesmium sp. MAG_R03]|nr:transposase [Trichodesmium sp. MAG_R03]
MEWTCSNCDVHHDHDGNASINIRNKGIQNNTDGSNSHQSLQ